MIKLTELMPEPNVDPSAQDTTQTSSQDTSVKDPVLEKIQAEKEQLTQKKIANDKKIADVQKRIEPLQKTDNILKSKIGVISKKEQDQKERSMKSTVTESKRKLLKKFIRECIEELNNECGNCGCGSPEGHDEYDRPLDEIINKLTPDIIKTINGLKNRYVRAKVDSAIQNLHGDEVSIKVKDDTHVDVIIDGKVYNVEGDGFKPVATVYFNGKPLKL